MLVALIALDKPGAQDLRLDVRPDHVAYLKASSAVHMAGPFLDGDGAMTGSLIVLDVESMAQAEAWAAQDPYAKADLFQSVTLKEWKKVIG